MKSLFEPHTCSEILSRLDQLEEGMPPRWGRMTVGQMAWHCQIPLKVGIENKAPKKKPNPLIIWLFKKGLYNDRPYRKNLPTSPFAKASEPRDLKEELPKLREMVEAFHRLEGRSEWNPHPIFGVMTREQWGKMQYKHLDHHLRQFGI
jgi:hypothetical protein